MNPHSSQTPTPSVIFKTLSHTEHKGLLSCPQRCPAYLLLQGQTCFLPHVELNLLGCIILTPPKHRNTCKTTSRVAPKPQFQLADADKPWPRCTRGPALEEQLYVSSRDCFETASSHGAAQTSSMPKTTTTHFPADLSRAMFLPSRVTVWLYTRAEKQMLQSPTAVAKFIPYVLQQREMAAPLQTHSCSPSDVAATERHRSIALLTQA